MFEPRNMLRFSKYGYRKRCIGLIFLLLFCMVSHYHFLFNEVEEDVTGWEFNRSRNVSDYIEPSEITTIISSPTICSDLYPPLVLLVICSRTENFEIRTAIRETWAHKAYEKFNVSVVFFMGVSENKQTNENVLYESKVYNDVIVEDFIDTYNNLTVKTLMMLKWMKNRCSSASYVMKTDDDVYINLKNLAQFINRTAEDIADHILCGRLECSQKPVPDRRSKWYMPVYMYPFEYYPNFLSGFGYLMSTQVALQLYEQSFHIPIIHMEDVFLTGLCAHQLGIKPARHYAFSERKVNFYECSPEDEYLIIHGHWATVEDMYKIHSILSNRCEPKKIRRSYLDWLLRRGVNTRLPLNLERNTTGPIELSYSCAKTKL